MKKLLLGSVVCLVIAIVAFMGGRWFERAKSGYHYKVLEQKEIKGADAPIHWKVAAESVGVPFLEPETTVIEVAGRTIYKAKRTFQESYPSAENVRVADGLIEWDDGEYTFRLKMDKLTPQIPVTGPGTAPAAQPPLQPASPPDPR